MLPKDTPDGSGLKSSPCFEALGLSCYRDDLCLFEGLDLVLKPGDLLRVEGSNGSGKTSLLRILSGLSKPDDGEVLWNGVAIDRADSGFSAILGYLGHLLGLKLDLTLEENLRLKAALWGKKPSEKDLELALQRMAISRCRFLRVRSLSQGQRQRVALMALSLFGGSLWILDEPFTALDVDGIALAESMLESHLHQGGMVIVTSHQALSIQAKSQRLVL